MRAENQSGEAPVEAEIAFDSGWTPFEVGAGKVEVTLAIPGRGMLGYAYPSQVVSPDGDVDVGPGGERNGQYARAFIIAENSPDPGRDAVVIVVCDLMMISQAVKRGVSVTLESLPWSQAYRNARVMLCATHTHSGIGGFSEFALYTYSTKGFDPIVTDALIAGIVEAIRQAHMRLQPGRVMVETAKLPNCGLIRSLDAFRANVPEAAEYPTSGNIDPQTHMLLLRLQHLAAGGAGWTDAGVVNWFALHPTNLGVRNQMVSGDNKGWAALLLEQRLRENSPGAVAAFANGAAGDVSPNVELSRPPDGGPDFENQLAGDLLRMKDMGQRQYEHALAILGDEASLEELMPPLAAGFRNIDITGIRNDSSGARMTWPAALGVSFGSGSTVDSVPYVDLPLVPSYFLASSIPEGVDMNRYVQERGQFFAAGGAAVLAALVLAPGTAVAFLPLIATSPYLQAWLAHLVLSIDPALKKVRSPDPTRTPWELTMPDPGFLPLADWVGHWPKPIMLAVGYTRNDRRGPIPLVPRVVPIQVMRIGVLALAAVPAEFTVIAGRRLKETIRMAMGGAVAQCAIAGYANGYAGYVTTREEYALQEYEGASTMYGPGTLEAFQQEFAKLAAAVAAGSNPDDGWPRPLPAVGLFPL
jgi:neutral ceramidase